MTPQSLNKKDNPSFSKKQESIILVSFFALIVLMVVVVAIAINDPSIYTSLGGI